jgi:hypothetical protein
MDRRCSHVAIGPLRDDSCSLGHLGPQSGLIRHCQWLGYKSLFSLCVSGDDLENEASDVDALRGDKVLVVEAR